MGGWGSWCYYYYYYYYYPYPHPYPYPYPNHCARSTLKGFYSKPDINRDIF